MILLNVSEKTEYSGFPCRSLGAPSQPGDAASSWCSPCGDRGLLDDHPAASVALRRAPAQWTTPCLAPPLPKTRVDGATAQKPSAAMICVLKWWWRKVQVYRSRAEVFGMFYWCLKIPKTRLAFIAQARPQGIANPMEEFMHHITFAKLVILCVGVCVCVFFMKKQLQAGKFLQQCCWQLSELNSICEIGRSSEVAQHWPIMSQLHRNGNTLSQTTQRATEAFHWWTSWMDAIVPSGFFNTFHALEDIAVSLLLMNGGHFYHF